MKKLNLAFIRNGIGAVSLILLVLLLWTQGAGRQTSESGSPADSSGLSITFAPQELIYDGTGPLNLMKGVCASNEAGDDLTAEVSAVITADSTLRRKVVRYLLVDDQGRQDSKTRTLVMENYDGPSLTVSDPLFLDSADLDNLIVLLEERGELAASDGYGKSIADRVTCVREQVGGKEYRMTFQVVNDYQDSAEADVTAYIAGDVKNPVLRLVSQEISVPQGSLFNPVEYLLSADDGSGGFESDRLQIQSHVDTGTPGKYRVVYRLYNGDKTACATEVMQVTVQGGRND